MELDITDSYGKYYKIVKTTKNKMIMEFHC